MNTATMNRPAGSPEAAIDLAAVKTKQQAAWSSGNYAVVGTTLQIVGENVCEAVDLRSGNTVLDIAAGNGNATLAAARRGCTVTSTDYVPALLDRGRQRASAEGLTVEFQTADAEALPFADKSFDAALSTFGIMFTADHDKAAAEMLRVVKSGGKIGMANWTPDGFIGQLFKTIGRYITAAPGVKSPALWGSEVRIREMFGAEASSIAVRVRQFKFRYRSAEDMIDVFRTFYGPMLKAFAALNDTDRAAFHGDIVKLIDRFNTSGDDTIVVPSDYLEIVIKRR